MTTLWTPCVLAWSDAVVQSSEVEVSPQAQKETSEGEATEDTEETKAAPDSDPQVEPVGSEQEGSRAAPMPMGVDISGSGMTGDAAEHTAAGGAAGMQAPTST